MRGRRAARLLLLAALAGCGGVELPPASGPVAPFLLVGEWRVGGVEVVADGERLGRAQRDLLSKYDVVGVIRDSTLDWLDQQGRFDPAGEIGLRVLVRDVRGRGRLAARLFGGLSGADRLAATVVATRAGELAKTYPVSVASALGGNEWSDPGERLQRLGRLLAQRIVEGL